MPTPAIVALVDDDAEIRGAMESLLRSHGVTMYAFESAVVPSLNSATPCLSSVCAWVERPFEIAPTALAKSCAPAESWVQAVERAVAKEDSLVDGGEPAFLIAEPQTTNELRMTVSFLLFALL